jgi:hypothetical protein
MPPSLNPGEFDHRLGPGPMSTLAFAMDQGARHSRESRNPFHAGHGFRGYSGSRLLRPARLLAPCTDLTGLPANGAFYFQAFNGSVVLPAVGYDYNSDWTPLLAGLSPAGMAASLAALVRPCSGLASRRSCPGAQKPSSRPFSFPSLPWWFACLAVATTFLTIANSAFAQKRYNTPDDAVPP